MNLSSVLTVTFVVTALLSPITDAANALNLIKSNDFNSTAPTAVGNQRFLKKKKNKKNKKYKKCITRNIAILGRTLFDPQFSEYSFDFLNEFPVSGDTILFNLPLFDAKELIQSGDEIQIGTIQETVLYLPTPSAILNITGGEPDCLGESVWTLDGEGQIQDSYTCVNFFTGTGIAAGSGDFECATGVINFVEETGFFTGIGYIHWELVICDAGCP